MDYSIKYNKVYFMAEALYWYIVATGDKYDDEDLYYAMDDLGIANKYKKKVATIFEDDTMNNFR